MGRFAVASREYLDSLISKRPNETKLGEEVCVIESEDWEGNLHNCEAKFVLLGIPEDIGVRANYGTGGTHTLWEPALKALLNTQETKALHGCDIMVLGAFDFSRSMARSEKMDIEHLRNLVGYVDETVTPLITKIAGAGKIPIVIGGGHNNCYPLLKGVSMACGKPVNCINLDAHSDFRDMEGRHSGNGFRYAHRQGYLGKYSVIGLHQNYNAQNILDELNDDPDLSYTFYEDIFIKNKLSFEEAVQYALAKTKGKHTGIELDMDCIEHVLSSAATPSGITSLQARQYLAYCAKEANVSYLHIAEGAVTLNDGRTSGSTPKLVAYLVTDFIKAYHQRTHWL